MGKISISKKKIVQDAKKKKKAPKKCSFCRNHGIIVPEARHKNCSWKKEHDCILGCKLAKQKIINAQNFRLKKKALSANNAENKIVTVTSDEQMEVEEIYTIEHDSTLHNLNTNEILKNIYVPDNVEKLLTDFNQNDVPELTISDLELFDTLQNIETASVKEYLFSMLIPPIDFPNRVFGDQVREYIKNKIQNVINSLTGFSPRIQCILLENGYIKVLCLDQASCEWLSIFIGNFSDMDIRLEAIPEEEFPKYYHMSLELDTETTIDQFLKRCRIQNKINTRRWSVRSISEIDGVYKFNFVVDPISYREICINNACLSIGLQTVAVDFLKRTATLDDHT